MENVMFFCLGVLLGFSIGGLVGCLIFRPSLVEALAKWDMWESEYWYLRSFPENTSRRLRWVKVGEAEC